tara:strand:+ start:300 stop:1046 length:747 start_codon:yes stop_codon:yes gene_type:complete
MLLGFNFIVTLLVIFPPLLYTFILYLTSPQGSIQFKNCIYCVIAGILSIGLLDFLNLPFSHWNKFYVFGDVFDVNFKVVAAREELVKYIMFIIMIINFRKEKTLHPVTYMLYFGMVGLGFALLENFGYYQEYGPFVLKSRPFNATLIHMNCGLLFGYWIGLSKIIKSPSKSNSVATYLLAGKPKLKSILYFIAGYTTAVLYHGIHNFNIATSGFATGSIMLIWIVFGLIVVKLLYRDLIIEYEKNKIE